MSHNSRTARCYSCGGLICPPQPPVEDIRVVAVKEIAGELQGCHEDAWRFLRSLIERDRPFINVGELAHELGIDHHRLANRFQRAGLPAARDYVRAVFLMRAAALLEFDYITVDYMLRELGRTPDRKTFAGLLARNNIATNPSVFRNQQTGRTMLATLRRELITPYIGIWKQFRPLVQLHCHTMPRVQPAGLEAAIA